MGDWTRIFYLLSPCHLRVNKPVFLLLRQQVENPKVLSCFPYGSRSTSFINISCIFSPSPASFLKWGSKDKIFKSDTHSIKIFLFVHSFFTNNSFLFFFFSYSYCTFSRHFYTIILTQRFFPRDNLDPIAVYFSFGLFLLLCTILYSSTLTSNCQIALQSLSIVRRFCGPLVHLHLRCPAWPAIIRRLLCLILHLFQDNAEQHQTQ